MRGRKPKPTVLKLLAGVPGHRALNENEPIPIGDLIDPPLDFSAEERDVWRRALLDAPVGLLRRLDSSLLEYWVRNHVMLLAEMAEVKKSGTTYVNQKTGSNVRSPHFAAVLALTQLCARLVSELGFNPTSRSRITLAGGGQKETNRFSNNAARRKA